MGVKDLWQVLAPVCERKSLWELQDKSVAVDLSAWVCDSQNIVEHSSQPNMHLRNLFFRTSCLLLLGAKPVFVLEGDAPDLKLNVMSQRNAARGLKKSTKTSGKRSRYKGIQKKCQEMLKCMGVHCVQSAGEAEALCAILNERGVVDGCISQDSDCFLYGGQVVFRNFTISATSGGGGGPGFSIDMYRMQQVTELLGLSRTKLIGLSLLCGCDYNQGVSGVGKETAVKFLATLSDAEVFSRFSRWRTDPIYVRREKERSMGVCDRCCHIGKKKVHDKSGCELCGTVRSCHISSDPDCLINLDPDDQKVIINELNIRKKALQDESFPCQDVIDEFCSVEAMPLPEKVSLEWSQPNLIQFMKLAEKHLRWDECYSLEKFLPLVTRWLILNKRSSAKCPIYPEAILKTRVLKGVASYEVKWTDQEGLFETLVSEECSDICLTIEPRELFGNAFPALVTEFNAKEDAKKLSKQKGKSKPRKAAKVSQALPKCPKCGKDLPSKTQKCMCHFVKVAPAEKEKTSPKSLEELLDTLTLNSASSKREMKEPAKTAIKSKVAGNSEKLKKLLSQVSDETDTGASPTLDCESEQLNKTYESPKFSFEDLLGDEKWTVDDFVVEEEGDLSDIVQSITGRGRSTDEMKAKMSKSPVPTHDMELENSKEEMCMEHTTAMPVLASGDVDVDSSEEEAPYTPLIDRIRKLQENKVPTKRHSIVAAMKLRRFSESFEAFCMGDNATSSPRVSNDAESSSGDMSGPSPNTFSLGITNLLETSEQQ
ncbi:flap endonuclease GEN [Thrips palmi]|uniref:Flap endonuclease GEN n=1 Tax=Thrips palmi TaxID=161013 RepID=A0A6P8Y1H9_THRPL|nr:flap endonuclease GEN [Thrips palmi]